MEDYQIINLRSIFKKNRSLVLFFILTLCSHTICQSQIFSYQDSLRGSLREERTCFDVNYYDLAVNINPSNQSISGCNKIYFTTTKATQKIQIDLFSNLNIISIRLKNNAVTYIRDKNAVFVYFKKTLQANEKYCLTIKYDGKPVKAQNPPWDGGFVWTKDSKKQHWIALACEGTGASCWFPNKDHLSDEPDSASITVTVPKGLMCVSNGKLRKTSHNNLTSTYYWHVQYPINNYNITINIANYKTIHDTFTSSDGQKLDLNYYVFEENLAKAKTHFQQVKPMLQCYEKYFGKYPFYNDGYALVETPYWGMEHQSAIAYGNRFKNNEYDFDFIIIHESGHEWFGNSLSCNDPAEMWIHESFTTYMESIYVEETLGRKKSEEYLEEQSKKIRNKVPLIGPSGVNYQHPDSDIYYKGTWMLHKIRQKINNDTIWFSALKSLAEHFKIANVNTQQIIEWLSTETRTNLKPIFDDYLYSTNTDLKKDY